VMPISPGSAKERSPALRSMWPKGRILAAKIGRRATIRRSALREVLACFEVAAALGYMPDVEPELRRRFDHVLGTLVRLVGGH
jgi:hypothetical protein